MSRSLHPKNITTNNALILSISLFALIIHGCSPIDPSLTLDIPEEGFNVVQYIHPDSVGRDKNALYLPPREIDKDEFSTPELNVFIDSLYAVMLRSEGVGIASNQIGKRLQIFIIEAEASNARYKVLGAVPKQVFINPRITKTSTTRNNFWHGCLSARDSERGNVATFEWIEYACRNQQGVLQQGRLDGFAAVIFQHEFRHMMGGTYLDHANHFLPIADLNEGIASGELPFFELASDTLPMLIEGYEVGETLDGYHTRVN